MAAPLPCPHCAVAMREVSARARSGYLIALDQCPQCGGVWCDRWELFPLAADEAARLDPVDAERLCAPAAVASGPGRCPRCTAALQPFRDPVLPPDARIERCRVCDGMWMNRGELARAKRRAAGAARPPAAQAEQLAASYAGAARWSTVSNLDAALYAADREDVEPGEDLRAALRSAAPWIVLRALLRLLFHV